MCKNLLITAVTRIHEIDKQTCISQMTGSDEHEANNITSEKIEYLSIKNRFFETNCSNEPIRGNESAATHRVYVLLSNSGFLCVKIPASGKFLHVNI